MTTAITSFDGEHAWLSNFYPVAIKFDGLYFQSVEAAYQAAKTLDWNARKEIAKLGPGGAKRYGKTVTLREHWCLSKVGIMEQLLAKKFRDLRLCGQLLRTGDAELIEGNDWGDTFWGKCNGQGLNMLGVLLMQRRELLKRTCKHFYHTPT